MYRDAGSTEHKVYCKRTVPVVSKILIS